MIAESPLILIAVNSPSVDRIVVSREDCGWKIDGLKGDKPVWSLDQLQDDFSEVIRVLAPHVDDASTWTLSPEMKRISSWQAMLLLTRSVQQVSVQ